MSLLIKNVCSDLFHNNNYTAGPVVESTMTLTLLHTRDVSPNVQFRFNVSRGLPSRLYCTGGGITLLNVRGFVSGVNYEVLRPLYVNISQPEITRVSFEGTLPRLATTYTCIVYVEGHTNIASATSYDFDVLGSATCTATVTGE